MWHRCPVPPWHQCARLCCLGQNRCSAGSTRSERAYPRACRGDVAIELSGVRALGATRLNRQGFSSPNLEANRRTTWCQVLVAQWELPWPVDQWLTVMDHAQRIDDAAEQPAAISRNGCAVEVRVADQR